jgi:hypothetical protein
VREFGELDSPRLFSTADSVRTVKQIARFFAVLDRGRLIIPKRIDALATMPSEEPYQTAEAFRRVLPELRKLDRYERRAVAQRDRAVRGLYG